MKEKDVIELRALEPSDVELLYKWENDQHIWRVSNTIVPFSKYILNKYIENSHLDIYQTRQLRLMIELHGQGPDNRVPIGTVDLFDFDPYHNRAGIGILIADEKYRGKGYASMALTTLLDYTFNTLQLHQVYCNVLMENQPSLTLFKNHGFEIIGNKKEWIKTPKMYLDEYILQCINPAYK